MSFRKVLAFAAVLATAGVVTFTQVTAASASVPPVTSGTGLVGSVASGGRSCLDNKGGDWTAGNPLQIWRCGADNRADQEFQLAPFRGAQVLRAVAPHGKPQRLWCVTAGRKGAALTIQHCTGKSDQAISLKALLHGYYRFANGLVMGLAGRCIANGTKVEGWPLNGGKNQQWSLPV